MDNFATPWRKWCCLCARRDSDTNRDIGDTLKEALGKHFGVQMSVADITPKSLCQDCHTLVSSLAGFTKHVELVQQMYKFLIDNLADESCNLQAIRMKFGVCDGNTGKWCLCKGEPSLPNTTLEISILKKADMSNIESDYSEYEENYESVCKQERLYDEEDYVDDKKVNDNDFETASEDSVWGDDDENDEINSTSLRESPEQNIQLNVETTAETPRKIDNATLKQFYTKKRPMMEDFVLDIECTVCKQKFDLFSAYCEHMEEVHGSGNQEKNCPICERNLQTWYHLGKHMRTHMSSESRYPIKCPECDSRYTTSAMLEVHLNHKHRNEKPFICEVCGFSGATKQSLSQHMYKHTDDAPHECEVCKKRFKKKTRLNFHMDVHGPNKFVCTICGLQLNTRATLRKHFIVHSDKKRHKCDFCGKSFKRSKSLKDHLLLHTGLKPYACNFCDRAYSNRQPCRSHMVKMHPEELAAMEAAGNKAYTQNVPTLASLKETIKTAENLKPAGRNERVNKFACTVCDRTFVYRSSCMAHMKEKHPEEYASLLASDNKAQRKHANRLRARKSISAKAKPPGDPVACEFCGRTFGYRKLCQNHIKRIHADRLEVQNDSNIRIEDESIDIKAEEYSILTEVDDTIQESSVATTDQDLFLVIHNMN